MKYKKYVCDACDAGNTKCISETKNGIPERCLYDYVVCTNWKPKRKPLKRKSKVKW